MVQTVRVFVHPVLLSLSRGKRLYWYHEWWYLASIYHTALIRVTHSVVSRAYSVQFVFHGIPKTAVPAGAY